MKKLFTPWNTSVAIAAARLTECSPSFKKEAGVKQIVKALPG
jgi:hypothetical protein